jgi:benzoyl-CoA reductase/2-hydroxyglutaryl-CoA dehydratase subunit BcrC/BadD/HgdB
METIRRLEDHSNIYLLDLQEERKKGIKLVGFIPNGYLPEELIHACGALPVALFRGGESSALDKALPCLGRFLDPFCRAQIGYRITGREPSYQTIDLLIVPITDQHHRGIADSWNINTDTEVFELGIPKAKTKQGLEYYLQGLNLLKGKLESLTGNAITEQRLKEEIYLANQIRSLLKKISLLRMSDPPPLMGREFVRLVHNSFYVEPNLLRKLLKELWEELRSKEFSNRKGVRILIIGSTLAFGDYRVLDLLEESGASVVMEEFSEGIKDYWFTVCTRGSDLLSRLATHYFMKRLPGAFFRGSSKERFDHFKELIRKFRINGVVSYSLLYRETYDIEIYLLDRILGELNIPMLSIKSDYISGETGSLRTRIETFIHTVNRRQQHVF